MPKYVKEVQKQSNFEVITYKNINTISKNNVIHIPVSPLIYPNSKFLLHLFAILKKRKLILQYHGDIRKEMQLKFKYGHSLNIADIPSYIAMPYLLRSANKLIVNSYFMSNLVKASYGVKNAVVIPNGIDNFWFGGSNETNIELDGDPIFFYHGRLSPEKGVDLLLKGFAKAIGKHSKAKLYIVGDGPQLEHFKKLRIKFGIAKNVVFSGQINRNHIKSYLSTADAAIYPSTWDNFPLAFMEAFSSANGPVYFSKLAGVYDFVMRDGYNLNAFEPTVENISKIIQEIVKGNYDRQVVEQQKEFARRYAWHKVIDQYIELYKNFVNFD